MNKLINLDNDTYVIVTKALSNVQLRISRPSSFLLNYISGLTNRGVVTDHVVI